MSVEKPRAWMMYHVWRERKEKRKKYKKSTTIYRQAAEKRSKAQATCSWGGNKKSRDEVQVGRSGGDGGSAGR